MRKHAKLSASGSGRWIGCPGSVKAEEGYPDVSSVYAEEGTTAHELAEKCLTEQKDANFYKDEYKDEMIEYVQIYLDYIRDHQVGGILIEARVDFSHLVPGGFGTVDCAIYSHKEGIYHIFDLKYGKGVKVDAYENTQAQIYALGLYQRFIDFCEDDGELKKLKTFRIHIVQPRRDNISSWDVSVEDLLKFGQYIKEKAQIALAPDAKRIAGKVQCKWCKAKKECEVFEKFKNFKISDLFPLL